MNYNLDELLELLIYYADSIGSRRDHKAGKDMYTCPFCHSGEHGIGSTGAMHIGRSKDGKLLYYCHSCNSGGNIVNMYCQYHGITQTRENFPQIINGIRQDLGLSTENYQDFKKSYKFKNPVQNEDLKPQSKVNEKDYTNFFNLALQNQGKAIDYLRNVRKIKYAESIARYFQLGFIPNYAYEWKDNQPHKTTSAIIIPTSQHSYAWRGTTENLKKKSGMVKPLNIEVLNDKSKKYLFLVEGEFDLFSILDITNDIQNCEFSAISVNSAGNLPKFLDNQIKANIQKDTTLIIALDNDEKPNLNVEKFIKQGLNIAKKNKIPCIVADIKELYLNQKDSNEALKFNREEFKKSLINEVEKVKNSNNKNYFETSNLEINEENITKPLVLEYMFQFTNEIDILNYIQLLKDKAIKFRKVKALEPLLTAYKKEAFKHLKEKELKKKYEEISNRYPKWIETNQDGKPLQTIENCIQILENSKEYQGTIAFNEFSNRIMINHTNNWTDFNYSDMVHYMERNFKITNENKINHAFKIVAQRNKYHPIRDYLNSLTWDGIERVNRVFIEFLGAHDTIYSQKVSAITFIGAVSRVFNPGVKYDTMPVFVGKQGIGKSKFIRKIAVNPDWFTDGVTTFDGKEFYESIQGKWLIELGEGTAFQKSIKERSKQAIASQQDFYREPYARNPEVRKRQCIFFGTTNNYDFLKDETGDRRYYPIDVNINRTTKNIDNDLNSEYINQLWAEAVYRYNQNEEIYITDTEILRIAEIEQKAHFDASPIQMDIYNFTEIMIPEVEQWYSYSIESRKRYIRAVQNGEDTIKSMCMRGAYKRDRISIKEIACELYGYELNQPIDRKFSLEISRTLTSLGWNKSGKTIKLKYYGTVKIYEKE